jgi:hypothetical protein
MNQKSLKYYDWSPFYYLNLSLVNSISWRNTIKLFLILKFWFETILLWLVN